MRRYVRVSDRRTRNRSSKDVLTIECAGVRRFADRNCAECCRPLEGGAFGQAVGAVGPMDGETAAGMKAAAPSGMRGGGEGGGADGSGGTPTDHGPNVFPSQFGVLGLHPMTTQ